MIDPSLLPDRLAVPSIVVAREVQEREYRRLLQWPVDREMTPEVAERAEQARRWYEEWGQPSVHLRLLDVLDCGGETVALDRGEPLQSPALAKRLREARASALVIAAVTAGREVDQETASHWRRGEVDEAYFLDRFGACVAEHLLGRVRVELCQRLEPEGFAVLRGLGPGHTGWPTEDLTRVVALLAASDGTLPSPLGVLESGMMQPKCSAITAFGLTRQLDHPEVTDAAPCEVCDLRGCRFRRRPHRHETS